MRSVCFFIVPLLGLLSLCSVDACDFTLTNDGSDTIVVIDPNNGQALILAPKESGMINPSIPGMRRFQNLVPDYWPISWLRYPETLDIYIMTNKNEANPRHYRVTERYCTPEPNVFSLSELMGYATTPHPRLNVYQLELYQPAAHDHGEHAH